MSDLYVQDFPRYLYHGTSARAAEQIEKNGLRPTMATGMVSNWKEHPSRPDSIYLTRAYAPYYALCAADVHDSDGMVVFEIDTAALDRKLFLPDEDAMEQISRSVGKGHPLYCRHKDITKRTAWFRDNAAKLTKGLPQLVDVSLSALGNACYRGDIPQIALTQRLQISSPLDVIRDWGDPTITVMNYRVLGHRYRVKTDQMFKRHSFERDLQMVAEWERAREAATTAMKAQNDNVAR